ncbi:MAG: sodium:alanine symporter family protein [Clostridiales bacterium]|jgi:AGCS family alanine or glycine:cation symporter|nr:sodium:alanine symporter family protein [Clostridiales bacterium]
MFAWLNEIVWGAPMLLLLSGTGALFTLRTGFVQFRRFGEMFRRLFRKNPARAPGDVTPFQAMTTALAATVGTGNIAGVAGAIALGGPGAVFWMWVSALFGMATKYAEVVLAIRFREKNARGEWVGGPMYYIRGGLPRRFHFLAPMFSLFGALAAFGIGNIVQTNTLADAVSAAVCALDPAAAPLRGRIALTAGILSALFAGLVLLGGAKRIGRVTEKLVPFMSAAYTLAALWVIFANAGEIGGALSSIVRGAFNPSAAVGGAAGMGIARALRHGAARGTFSNEAGMGSAPIAHAAAQVDRPSDQGLFGMFEVFMDTIVLCTLTALAILTSGVFVPYGSAAGAELAIASFATAFGERAASVAVALGISLFALSTILSWSLYGERCFSFLFGERAGVLYRGAYILLIAAGAVMRIDVAWSAAGALNGLMAVPNLAALVLLSGKVREPGEASRIKYIRA